MINPSAPVRMITVEGSINRNQAGEYVIDLAEYAKPTKGRVRSCPCGQLLPSEPDVRVSPHPAQAFTKPRVSGAGFTTV